jgi:hypothetical protein
MKNIFTGIICMAAILATSVVLLPAAALMIAVRLSKHRDNSRKYSPHADMQTKYDLQSQPFAYI